MLLRNIVLLVHVSLEGREDVALLKQHLTALALDVEQRIVSDACGVCGRLAILRWDSEVLELLAENDDGLLGEQRVVLADGREARKVGLGDVVGEMLLCCEESRCRCRAVESIGCVAEEVEHV